MSALSLGRSCHGSEDQDGLTLVEVTVAMAVIAVAFLGFSTVIMQSSTLHAVNREKTQVYNACRDLVERMRAESFSQLLALYNTDTNDDPGQAGSAPGRYITLEGTELPGGDPIAEVMFPMPSDGAGVFMGGSGLNLAATTADGASQAPAAGVDAVLAQQLGLVDSNSDGEIDQATNTESGAILPVRIIVSWRGITGESRFEFTTLLRNS